VRQAVTGPGGIRLALVTSGTLFERSLDMKVLLAGASGAIGMPLIARLRAAGHEVLALCRSPEGRARLGARRS
jgi:NADPH:quinone reductase-like Zn-dependent oxidoreductase